MSQRKSKLLVKEDTKIFSDMRTLAKTFAIPFRLPDGVPAVLMISRLKDEGWIPFNVIKSITITYQ